MRPDPATVLRGLGGHAPYRRLVAEVGRSQVRRAVARGEVLSTGRGRYALAGLDAALVTAVADGGALCRLSAAVHHGWGVVAAPSRTQVAVPAHAHRDADAAHHRHYTGLTAGELLRGVTSPLRTVVDCARHLPPPEGLAVADSALRAGAVERSELQETARALRGPGARNARLVLLRSDERAANAFESALRGHLLVAGITSFVPQLVVAEPGFLFVADLGDPDAKVVLEADGYGVHGNRRAFAADLARHDELQRAGWVTRRFAWEHVMHRPAWVVDQVRSALAQRVVQRPRVRRRRASARNRAA